jgi:hypothetical protein
VDTSFIRQQAATMPLCCLPTLVTPNQALHNPITTRHNHCPCPLRVQSLPAGGTPTLPRPRRPHLLLYGREPLEPPTTHTLTHDHLDHLDHHPGRPSSSCGTCPYMHSTSITLSSHGFYKRSLRKINSCYAWYICQAVGMLFKI